MSEANENKVWVRTTEDKLKSLLGDEAKNAAMLEDIQQTVKQLRAKNSFRLAIVNQMLDEHQANKSKE
jgi:hypothetical protein